MCYFNLRLLSIHKKQTRSACTTKEGDTFESFSLENHGVNSQVLALAIRAFVLLNRSTHFTATLLPFLLTGNLDLPRPRRLASYNKSYLITETCWSSSQLTRTLAHTSCRSRCTTVFLLCLSSLYSRAVFLSALSNSTRKSLTEASCFTCSLCHGLLVLRNVCCFWHKQRQF